MVVRIQATHSSFGYGEGPIVRGVSLEVREAELLTIVGPNGAGKSTLIKGLAGLISPSEGRVEAAGESLCAMDLGKRAKMVAVLPQSLRHLQGITVAEFVAQGRYVHRPSWQHMGAMDEEVIGRSLQRCELGGLKDRPMNQLSGGERQRAVFARALAQESDILLVDEPTAALDGRHQLWIFEQLASLAASSTAVVAVTHDLNLASQFSHRVVLMEDGAVSKQGDPKDVLTPGYLKGLLGENFLTGQETSSICQEERPWFIPWLPPPSS